jgi:hypothetical protein
VQTEHRRFCSGVWLAALGQMARGLRHLLAGAHLRQIIGGAGRRCGRLVVGIQQSSYLCII